MLSTLNCETKQDDTNTDPHLSYLVQPNLHGKPQRLPSLKVLWMNIFSYSGPTEKGTAPLRRSCKLSKIEVLNDDAISSWGCVPHDTERNDFLSTEKNAESFDQEIK